MQLFKNPRVAVATAATSAALVGAGAVVGVSAVLDDDPVAARQVSVASATPAASSDPTTVGEIYKRSSASVVEITVGSAGEASPFGGDGGTQQAQGSGFVYDTEGHVITNQHVVDGAETVSVTFANGKEYSAKVVGGDPSTDIAVIDVDAPASELKPLELADSSDVEVGDGVDRDRQPVRARADGHDRNRQRAASPDHVSEPLRDRRRDPDGRGDQPRQLGRPAARHGR